MTGRIFAVFILFNSEKIEYRIYVIHVHIEVYVSSHQFI